MGNVLGQKARGKNSIKIIQNPLVLEGDILFEAVQPALAVNLAGEGHSLSMDASVTVFAHSSSSFSLLTSITPAFSRLSRSRFLLIQLPVVGWPGGSMG